MSGTVFALLRERPFLFMKSLIRHIALVPLALLVAACFSEPEKLADMEEYDGPRYETTDVNILVSDSTVIKLVMSGPRQLTHANNDLEFPEGIKIVFYDIEGKKTSEVTAQKGYYAIKTKLYKVTGYVVVKNLQKMETLRSEELFWDPSTEKIYTDKFVTVETEDQLIQAEGMEAPQDFSTYTFKKIRDTIFKLEESNENPN